MYERPEKKQEQEKQPVPEIRGQQGADPLEIGNEALTHYFVNDLNIIGTRSQKKGKRIAERREPGKGCRNCPYAYK